MGIGSAFGGWVSGTLPRVELDPGLPALSAGQIVNGRVAQVGPRGAVIEIAGRLATLPGDLGLSVGETVQLTVREAGRERTVFQLVGRDGILLAAETAADPRLARLLASYRLPTDRAHLNAVRKLLARGIAITRENLERMVRTEGGGTPVGLEMERTDSVLAELVESYDLPADRAHLFAARQLLARGMAVGREEVAQLARTMASLGATEEADFQAATFLLAADLPLTASAVAVVRAYLEAPGPLGRRFHQMQQTLAWALQLLEALEIEMGDVPRPVRHLLGMAAEALSARVVRAFQGDKLALMEALRLAVRDQGTSLEHLLRGVEAGDLGPADVESDLRCLLGRLGVAVSPDVPGRGGGMAPDQGREWAGGPMGRPELQEVLRHVGRLGPALADVLQLQQMRNAASPDGWVVFQVPCLSRDGGPPMSAELRVGVRSSGGSAPRTTRLLLRLDLPRLRRVEVRVELAGRRIGCRVAGDAEALPMLEDEFGELKAALEALGFEVGDPRFGPLAVEPDPLEVASAVPERLPRVDLRV